MSINKYKLNIIVINLQNNINLQYIYLLSLFILEFCSRIFDIFVKFGKAAAANDPTSQNRCRWTSTLEKIEFSRQLVPYLKAAVLKYNNPLNFLGISSNRWFLFVQQMIHLSIIFNANLYLSYSTKYLKVTTPKYPNSLNALYVTIPYLTFSPIRIIIWKL